jgi:release factor glutamine methyltransferase
MNELDLVARDKYEGRAELVTPEDTERLAAGEPLAYVIGWVPFLGNKIFVTYKNQVNGVEREIRALIPRPETEYWTQLLIAHLKVTYPSDKPFTLLDLCAGSGAIGIAVLAAFPAATVFFSDNDDSLSSLILKNIHENVRGAEKKIEEEKMNGKEARAHIVSGDLFDSLEAQKYEQTFDVIVTNPPYIPATRQLEDSVTKWEPHEALFAGEDGLGIIREILQQAPHYLGAIADASGEVWMECDIENIEEAKKLAEASFPDAEISILPDHYNRPRVLRVLKTRS